MAHLLIHRKPSMPSSCLSSNHRYMCLVSGAELFSPAFVPPVSDAEMNFMVQCQWQGWVVVMALLSVHCQQWTQGRWQCPNQSISEARPCLCSHFLASPCLLPYILLINSFSLNQTELFSITCNHEPSETKLLHYFRRDSRFISASPSESRKGRIYGFVKRDPFCLQPGTKYVRKSDNIEPKSLPQANINERKEKGGNIAGFTTETWKSLTPCLSKHQLQCTLCLTNVSTTHAQALYIISGIHGSQRTFPVLDAPKQIESFNRQ